MPTFSQKPTYASVRALLGRTIQTVVAQPKYLICDCGSQFDNDAIRARERLGNLAVSLNQTKNR